MQGSYRHNVILMHTNFRIIFFFKLLLEKNEFDTYPLLINIHDIEAYFDNKDITKIRNYLLMHFGHDKVHFSESKLILQVKYSDIISHLLKRTAYPISEIVRVISWKSFEQYIAGIFSEYGFKVITNLHFIYAHNRREIDIIASNRSFVFLIDAKHWTHTLSESQKHLIIKKQKERCILFLQYIHSGVVFKKHRFLMQFFSKNTLIYPLIITLYTATPQLVDGILIFPINLIESFFRYFDEIREHLWYRHFIE